MENHKPDTDQPRKVTLSLCAVPLVQVSQVTIIMPTAADRRRAAERQRRLRERRAEERRQAELRQQQEQPEEAARQAAEAEQLRQDRAEAYRQRERERLRRRRADEAIRERERERQQQRQADDAHHERQREQARRRREERRAQPPAREARHVAAVLSGEQAVPLNTVGDRDRGCQHCGALLWPDELSSLCCADGRVQLAPLPAPPPILRQLWTEDSAEAKVFRKHARHLNASLALASQVVRDVRPPQGGYAPSVIIQGRLYHRMGPLRARDGEVPRFAQLYIHDPHCEEPEAEAALRLGHVRLGRTTPAATQRVLLDLLQRLQQLMRDRNPYVNDLIMACEVPEDQVEQLRLVINADVHPEGEHARRYNRPEGFMEVSVLIDEEPAQRDLVLRLRVVGDGRDLDTISDCHRSYEPLHFVLLYPLGTDGWYSELRQTPGGDRKMSALQYAAHRLQTRPDSDDSLLRACRLLQEYCCTMFARVEAQRLLFISTHQRELRAALYQHVFDAVAGDVAAARADGPPDGHGAGDAAAAAAAAGLPVARGAGDAAAGAPGAAGPPAVHGAGDAAAAAAPGERAPPRRVGRRVILPPTFIGGPRHMTAR